MTKQRRLLFILLFALSACSVPEVEPKIQTVEQERTEEAEKQPEDSIEAEEQQDEVTEEQPVEQNKQQSEEELASQFNLEKVMISRIVDGDTVVLSDGRKVRLIGVNTPESTTRTETFGEEAKNFTKTILDKKEVWIQRDVSETDRYSRYLRIIWLSVPIDDRDENEIRQKMFNAHLVLKGYAEPSTYPPDVKYSNVFVKFAREARESNIGLWVYGPNGTTKGDMDKSTPNPSSLLAESGKTVTYQNCTELRKVYPDGVPSTHPAYASKHDRDKDNWACE
ncbi:nuclease [Bacillus sp. BGMRC 2118]|nr:nuclease [Bacillus sp. BGMRC 2118]